MQPPRNAQGHPPAPGAYPGRNYQNYPAYGTPEPPKKRRGFLLPLLIVLLLLLVGGGGVFAFMHFRDSAESSSISEDRADCCRGSDLTRFFHDFCRRGAGHNHRACAVQHRAVHA